MLKRTILSLLFCLSMAGAVQAVEVPMNISVSVGWRYDNITTKISSQIPKGTTIAYNTIKGKELKIWEGGIQGYLPFAECFCNCDCWWLNVFYLKGYGFWGNIYDGEYHELNHNLFPPNFIVSKGDASKGNTYDYNVALGWLYSVNDCSGIAPIVGYAWDRVRFKTSHVKTEGIEDHVLNGLKYTSRFIGPWAGVEAYYVKSNLRLNLGYEYHWSHWNGKYDLRGPDVFGGAYSDHRKAHEGQGNVLYANGSWFCCDCWEIMLGFKYRNFRATHGSEKPDAAGGFAAIGLPETEYDRINHTAWHSYEITFDITYVF